MKRPWIFDGMRGKVTIVKLTGIIILILFAIIGLLQLIQSVIYLFFALKEFAPNPGYYIGRVMGGVFVEFLVISMLFWLIRSLRKKQKNLEQITPDYS